MSVTHNPMMGHLHESSPAHTSDICSALREPFTFWFRGLDIIEHEIQRFLESYQYSTLSIVVVDTTASRYHFPITAANPTF
jgi:hypothetical protein